MTTGFQPNTIAEHLALTVKKIEVSLKEGGTADGTGYLFETEADERTVIRCVVTNRHVLKDGRFARIVMHTEVCGEPDGKWVYLIVPLTKEHVVVHPNPDIDLAAILIGPSMNRWQMENPGRDFHFMTFSSAELWPDSRMAELDVAEQIVMVGCPNGLWDEVHGLPLYRRGSIASPPAIDFRGRSEFVVDVAVVSGSSGSPIILMDVSNGEPARRMAILGTLWGGPHITETGEVTIGPAPTNAEAVTKVAVRMHLGYVVKARETLVLSNAVKSHVELLSFPSDEQSF